MSAPEVHKSPCASFLLKEPVLEFQKNIIETAVMSTSEVHKSPCASSLLREPVLELKKNIMENHLRLKESNGSRVFPKAGTYIKEKHHERRLKTMDTGMQPILPLDGRHYSDFSKKQHKDDLRL
jgi:hypothetical protein